jgi:hypothetical protein
VNKLTATPSNPTMGDADKGRAVRQRHDHGVSVASGEEIIERGAGLAAGAVAEESDEKKINNNDDGQQDNVLHCASLPFKFLKLDHGRQYNKRFYTGEGRRRKGRKKRPLPKCAGGV